MEKNCDCLARALIVSGHLGMTFGRQFDFPGSRAPKISPHRKSLLGDFIPNSPGTVSPFALLHGAKIPQPSSPNCISGSSTSPSHIRRVVHVLGKLAIKGPGRWNGRQCQSINEGSPGMRSLQVSMPTSLISLTIDTIRADGKRPNVLARSPRAHSAPDSIRDVPMGDLKNPFAFKRTIDPTNDK